MHNKSLEDCLYQCYFTITDSFCSYFEFYLILILSVFTLILKIEYSFCNIIKYLYIVVQIFILSYFSTSS